MTVWHPMSEAPRDGTVIQAVIPGNGSDNMIAWHADALMDELGQPCGAWAFESDQEPPDCWTDGWCWESNEDEQPSVYPTEWTLTVASPR